MTSFRQLATNVVGSISKGQRVVVSGRLRVRDWESGDRAGTTVEIDADAIGHDLSWGSAVFTRSVTATVANDGDQSSERAAVLDASREVLPDGPPEGSRDGASDVGVSAGEQGDSGDELAAARSQPSLEMATPF
ncbi:MAG: single-stranded DNA-binding protein [Acidobacteria bacterium]|nr:single-stranded DNA-binding protein [Acidobacteriota bacterium]